MTSVCFSMIYTYIQFLLGIKNQFLINFLTTDLKNEVAFGEIVKLVEKIDPWNSKLILNAWKIYQNWPKIDKLSKNWLFDY